MFCGEGIQKEHALNSYAGGRLDPPRQIWHPNAPYANSLNVLQTNVDGVSALFAHALQQVRPK